MKIVKVDSSNYNDCIKLTVSEEQKGYVASNINSLVLCAYEPETYPLAIYNENIMVGFILYDLDNEIGGWSMSRFMIDKRYQNKGLGKKALKLFLEYFYNKHGLLKLYTSAELDNDIAIKIYEGIGFKKKESFTYNNDGITYREVRMLKDI